jgi:cyclin-D1-binding protein 1
VSRSSVLATNCPKSLTLSALSLLELASETCSAALTSLSNPRQALAQLPPDSHVLQQDLISLLSLLHNTTTKLGLALKPSSPTYSASFIPLKDISTHISAVAQCAKLFDPSVHGAALTQEIVSVVTDGIKAIKALLQTFLTLENGEKKNHVGIGQAGEEYLVRVGAVHEIIDKARSSDGISSENVVAVRRKWTADKASLEDGLREVSEMIEDEETRSDGDDDGDDDDGWAEVGISSRKRMGEQELERTKKVCP